MSKRLKMMKIEIDNMLKLEEFEIVSRRRRKRYTEQYRKGILSKAQYFRIMANIDTALMFPLPPPNKAMITQINV